MKITSTGNASDDQTKVCEQMPYVLLIDDDREDLEMISSAIESNGTTVKTFTSSTKAIFYLTHMSGKKLLPSLIILDYNMPIMNGHEVLLMVKTNADTKDVPVFIYSTLLSAAVRKQLTNDGAYACFTKPWTYEELKDQLKTFQELTWSFVSNKNTALR